MQLLSGHPVSVSCTHSSGLRGRGRGREGASSQILSKSFSRDCAVREVVVAFGKLLLDAAKALYAQQQDKEAEEVIGSINQLWQYVNLHLHLALAFSQAMTILAAGGGYASTTPAPAVAAKAAAKAATPLGA